MPLPKPSMGEDRQSFIDRCVGDDKITSEYTGNDQRIAVCISQFDEGKKMTDEVGVDLDHQIEDQDTKRIRMRKNKVFSLVMVLYLVTKTLETILLSRVHLLNQLEEKALKP